MTHFEKRAQELLIEWFYDVNPGDGSGDDRRFLLKVLREGARVMRDKCVAAAENEAEAWQDGESNATTCRLLGLAISQIDLESL